jgi:hypothetical protein
MIYVFDDVKSLGVLSVNSWMLFSHAALLEHFRVRVFLVSVILRVMLHEQARGVLLERSRKLLVLPSAILTFSACIFWKFLKMSLNT